MSKLKIEAHESFPDYNTKITTDVNPKNLEIKIFDGDELVAETTLESLVKKFLIMSSEYAQLMAAISAVKADKDSKIIIAKE